MARRISVLHPAALPSLAQPDVFSEDYHSTLHKLTRLSSNIFCLAGYLSTMWFVLKGEVMSASLPTRRSPHCCLLLLPAVACSRSSQATPRIRYKCSTSLYIPFTLLPFSLLHTYLVQNTRGHDFGFCSQNGNRSIAQFGPFLSVGNPSGLPWMEFLSLAASFHHVLGPLRRGLEKR